MRKAVISSFFATQDLEHSTLFIHAQNISDPIFEQVLNV